MSSTRRVRKGATDTLTAVFYDGGEAVVDKGACTVTVRSDTGTVLAGPTAATNTLGTYTYPLTLAATAALDLLAVSWVTGTETQTTYVEVVGGFYFELAELRAMQDLASTTTYPIERLRSARDWIENIIDQATGTSFVRRYARDHFNQTLAYDTLRTRFLLLTPDARAVLGASVAGVALTSPQLAGLTIDTVNRIAQSDGTTWPYGYSVVDFRYEAGLTDVCPADLHDVALQAARWRLISTDGASGIPSRATSLTNQFGNVELSTAGNRRPTGIPDVDAVIMSYADQYKVGALA